MLERDFLEDENEDLEDVEEPEEGEDVPGITIDLSSLESVIQEQTETQQLLLVSNQRIEAQLEGTISILLIFCVILILNYCYKFLRIFF